jgi:hypothetical protein
MEPTSILCFFLFYYIGTDYLNYCKAKERHYETMNKLNLIESKLISTEATIK